MLGKRTEDVNVLGKRTMDDSSPRPDVPTRSDLLDKNRGTIVPARNTTGIVVQFEASGPTSSSGTGTPRKSENKKKLKADDGAAIDSTSTSG